MGVVGINCSFLYYSMNLLKEVFAHEVYPALGCTEPIACAYAAALAAAELDGPVESLRLRVDRGTYKNGAAVVVPRSNGAKGNLAAAALGAALARPERKLELLDETTDEVLRRAGELRRADRCRIECVADAADFFVEAAVAAGEHQARCVLSGGHNRIALIEKDGEPIGGDDEQTSNLPPPTPAYRAALKQMSMAEVLDHGGRLDAADRAFVQRGVDMNLALAELGLEVGGAAAQLKQMHQDGFLAEDVFYRTKLSVAAAVDARMAGADRAAMTSGGSGNQGIVATLTPYLVGREMGVDHRRIIESIAAAHLLNAYVKCFVGELSVVCGCAMAAGIASAAAIVHQHADIDVRRITLAAGNVIGDLSGLICDGAKPGCAMKAVTAVDSAVRSALMALKGFGLSSDDGLLGQTIEESLENLGRITLEGMFQVDPTLLRIIREKTAVRGKA